MLYIKYLVQKINKKWVHQIGQPTTKVGQTFCYGQTSDNPETYIEVGKEDSQLTYNGWIAYKNLDFGYQDTYLGRQYVWPSQQQWQRSYVVNSNGYNWDGVTKYRTDFLGGDLEILKYAGYNVAGEDEEADHDKGIYTLDELQMIAHLGTRQFVLTNADVTVDTEEDKEPEYPISMRGNNWWTICVPFNMTKKQVDETFGEGTHVCRFDRVRRLVDSDGNKYLKLYFTKDMYVYKNEKDAKGNYPMNTDVKVENNDDVVIYAHESYMIYPTKGDKDVVTMYNIKDYKLEVGSPIPTIVKTNQNWESIGGNNDLEVDEVDEANSEYRFIGNYQNAVASAQSASSQSTNGVANMELKKVTVPQFSYIYASTNGIDYQFWFYTGTDMEWSPNKCVVQATAKDGGKNDAQTYFDYNVTEQADGSYEVKESSSTNAKKVYEFSYFGLENNETTGVERVEIIAGDGENAQVVYNLNGQVINTNGNMDNLQQGVYIKNGKKYMVK